MISVYDRFDQLWPEAARVRLKPLLSKVPALCLPEDRDDLNKVVAGTVILVVDELPLRDLIQLSRMGFEHIVQRGREDFAQELLASSLMLVRPESFFKNPLPFFLSGFDSDQIINDPDRHLIMRFTKRSEKEMLIDWLGVFLNREQHTNSIRDIVLQCTDEMINNALYNAPVLQGGKRAYKDLPRHTDIQMPATMPARLFACFADQRIVVGCTDSYGSLDKQNLLNHLTKVFAPEPDFNYTGSGGPGFGVRMMIENAANFYVLVDPGKFTLFACGFLLEGLKANRTIAKHIHLSFG